MTDVLASDDPMIDPEQLRAALGPDLTVATGDTSTVEALVDAAEGARALVVDVSTPVTAEAIAALEDLEIVARAGVGVDNVDVAAAAEHGVVVTNVQDYCTDEVATHAFALLLACLRKVPEYDRDVRAGGWDWSVGHETHRLPGMTLGLVSLGPIARRFIERLSGFDLDLVGYDPYVDEAEMADFGVEKVDFDGLLDRADHVSVHAPLTEETRGMFDADAFERLPDHAVVTNTGRGGVIDEADLAAALRDGTIAAAGLDVMAEEPPGDSPLFDCENAVLTPHAGWYSEEARDELNETVARNVAQALAGERPDNYIDPDLDWL